VNLWLKHAKTIDGFLGLQPNWDSYGAVPVTQEAHQAAMTLLKLFPVTFLEHIWIVPVPNGGIQFERAEDYGWEIEIGPEGKLKGILIDHSEVDFQP